MPSTSWNRSERAPMRPARAAVLTRSQERDRVFRPMSLALGALTAVGLMLAALQPALADPPGGVPPGLAKKGVDRHEWQARKGGGHDYRRGDVLRGGDYVVIRDYDRYGLRPPERGYSYYVVDGQVLRVADATLKVAAAIGAVSALVN